MILVAVPRREYALAVARTRLPALAARAAVWLAERSRWATGLVEILMPGRRLAYELRAGIREVRRAVAWLLAEGWLAVYARGPLGIPYYALTLPGRPLRVAEDDPVEPPRFSEDGVELDAHGAEVDPDDVHPAPAEQPRKTLAGRMLDLARAAVVAASLGGRAPLEDAPPLQRDMRLELVPGTPQYRERAVLEEQARQPMPEVPPELDEHFRASRHVGRLYPTREAAERAQRAAARQRAGPRGAGDWAPHRLVLLAYRQLHAERGASWAPSAEDHRAICMLIRKLGVQGAEGAIGMWGAAARLVEDPVPDLDEILMCSRRWWE